MALILNIETTDKVCSVALSEDYKIISTRTSKEEQAHALYLTVFIDQILKEQGIKIKNLDAIAVSKGPGSYTGLRIGISAAKGICYASEKPLLGVNTLPVICNSLILSGKLKEVGMDNLLDAWMCPMIDARRMEVYHAFYDLNFNPHSEVSALVVNENSFDAVLHSRKVLFFGNGSSKCKDLIKHPNALFIDEIMPHATSMVSFSHSDFERGFFEDTAYFEPFYLKDFLATTSSKNMLGF